MENAPSSETRQTIQSLERSFIRLGGNAMTLSKRIPFGIGGIMEGVERRGKDFQRNHPIMVGIGSQMYSLTVELGCRAAEYSEDKIPFCGRCIECKHFIVNHLALPGMDAVSAGMETVLQNGIKKFAAIMLSKGESILRSYSIRTADYIAESILLRPFSPLTNVFIRIFDEAITRGICFANKRILGEEGGRERVDEASNRHNVANNSTVFDDDNGQQAYEQEENFRETQQTNNRVMDDEAIEENTAENPIHAIIDASDTHENEFDEEMGNENLEELVNENEAMEVVDAQEDEEGNHEANNEINLQTHHDDESEESRTRSEMQRIETLSEVEISNNMNNVGDVREDVVGEETHSTAEGGVVNEINEEIDPIDSLNNQTKIEENNQENEDMADSEVMNTQNSSEELMDVFHGIETVETVETVETMDVVVDSQIETNNSENQEINGEERHEIANDRTNYAIVNDGENSEQMIHNNGNEIGMESQTVLTQMDESLPPMNSTTESEEEPNAIDENENSSTYIPSVNVSLSETEVRSSENGSEYGNTNGNETDSITENTTDSLTVHEDTNDNLDITEEINPSIIEEITLSPTMSTPPSSHTFEIKRREYETAVEDGNDNTMIPNEVNSSESFYNNLNPSTSASSNGVSTSLSSPESETEFIENENETQETIEEIVGEEVVDEMEEMNEDVVDAMEEVAGERMEEMNEEVQDMNGGEEHQLARESTLAIEVNEHQNGDNEFTNHGEEAIQPTQTEEAEKEEEEELSAISVISPTRPEATDTIHTPNTSNAPNTPHFSNIFNPPTHVPLTPYTPNIPNTPILPHTPHVSNESHAPRASTVTAVLASPIPPHLPTIPLPYIPELGSDIESTHSLKPFSVTRNNKQNGFRRNAETEKKANENSRVNGEEENEEKDREKRIERNKRIERGKRFGEDRGKEVVMNKDVNANKATVKETNNKMYEGKGKERMKWIEMKNGMKEKIEDRRRAIAGEGTSFQGNRTMNIQAMESKKRIEVNEMQNSRKEIPAGSPNQSMSCVPNLSSERHHSSSHLQKRLSQTSRQSPKQRSGTGQEMSEEWKEKTRREYQWRQEQLENLQKGTLQKKEKVSAVVEGGILPKPSLQEKQCPKAIREVGNSTNPEQSRLPPLLPLPPLLSLPQSFSHSRPIHHPRPIHRQKSNPPKPLPLFPPLPSSSKRDARYESTQKQQHRANKLEKKSNEAGESHGDVRELGCGNGGYGHWKRSGNGHVKESRAGN